MATHLLECWEGCDEEVEFPGPTRGTDGLVDGVKVACPNCGHQYKLTQDGDGELELESLDPESLGESATHN